MRTIDAIRRSGIGVRPEQTVREAAQVMERTGVGALAVVDGARLRGILTDRDLVRRVLARGTPSDARVDDVMTSPVVSIEADADLHEAFALFRTHGGRRLAVVRDGQFVGMVTVDDLLVDMARDLVDLSRPITAEIAHAHRDSALPVA
ncbi:MAG: CBS domain-containing protein [Acidimicrobiales bacterium]